MKIVFVVVIVSGCAPNIKRASYEEVYASQEHKFKPDPEPILYEYPATSPECDGTVCVFTEEDANKLINALDDMEALIIRLNEIRASETKEYNMLVNILIECEYGKAQRAETIEYQEVLRNRETWANIGKQAVLGVAALGCAILR